MFGLDPAGADFDPHRLAIDEHRDLVPGDRPPLDSVSSNAQRSCLRYQHPGALRCQRRVAQTADGVGWPAFLHDDRGHPGVVGARLHERSDGRGQNLTGGIIHVGFEQYHRLAGALTFVRSGD